MKKQNTKKKNTKKKFFTIAVSGTPGSGKTTIAKFLAKQTSGRYVDVGTFIKRNNLSEGYDRKMKCLIVDERKLARRLERAIDEEKKNGSRGIILDSHMSHYVDPKKTDFCIITKCDLKTLKKRLHIRKYTKQKIRDNLDAEIFDVCRQEAIEEGHKVMTIITDKEKEWKKQLQILQKDMKKTFV
ncbi:adenylate kinase family protein [Candidatus Woesearchaeota archaeon]|nr:adenylate kinase family protein [Candidatus Woesearchaeota archaeon]